ncbi:uncharacterized protein LOC116386357 isoform X2 [Anarrhichthys ocellatus]|uniref:uncharacterized protein LOC116386357 isoform X2 n=1 Tax=Anarrhichthys ocellatus TaxID=433405 RepID=UPI0012EDB593|nr:uncharacterized protein LOC116386357 isoform X2 [Anarrhichthys ocellatus]
MVSFILLRLCLISLTQAAAGLQLFDHLGMFALLGEDITLPCGIPSIESCSSVNWNMAEEFQSIAEVVKAGKVTAPSPNALRLGLLKDCSLKINHLELNDARLYSCDSGTLNSSVSLQILEVTERSTPAVGTIELHCFLNMYKGLAPCNNKGIHITWRTGDNTPLNGKRFNFDNPSECFSKLIITKKLTDHHRKWKCQLTQNDTVKATISYTTTIKDGIEEVFAAVGESVSLSCSDTSSLGVSVRGKWSVGERTLTDDMSPQKGQTEKFHVNEDSSLVISKVSALHAGDYQCSDSTDQQKVLNKIRLHTLDVTSERGPGGDNLTLTCVLTCTKECGKDINLTWSRGSQNTWQSRLMNVNNSLINRLFLPVLSTTSDEFICFVHRESDVMASKKWHTVHPLQTPAWVALPLALLICITAGGSYMYTKRKQHKDAGNEQSSIGMYSSSQTHVYEVIQDANQEELQRQRQPKRGAVATTDSFYDLLQAVN